VRPADLLPLDLCSGQNLLDDVLRQVTIAGEDDGIPEQGGQPSGGELLKGHVTNDAARAWFV
jgi:hypothetical protein